MWNGCAICMWHPNAVTFHTKIKHLNIVYRRPATITMIGRIMICLVNNCQYFLRWFHKVSRTKGLFRKIMFFMLKGLLCIYCTRTTLAFLLSQHNSESRWSHNAVILFLIFTGKREIGKMHNAHTPNA